MLIRSKLDLVIQVLCDIIMIVIIVCMDMMLDESGMHIWAVVLYIELVVHLLLWFPIVVVLLHFL